LSRTSTTFDGTQGYAATYLDETFSPERGVVLEGTLRAQALAAGAAAGLALDEGEGTSLATLMGIGAPEGRETRIGHLQAAAGTFNALDVTGKHCATVTGLEDGREHTFRLLSRRGMFELYVDDLLMQTYVYKPGAGRLGFAVRNAKADIKSLRAWEMSL
jgi:hypothetical protein